MRTSRPNVTGQFRGDQHSVQARGAMSGGLDHALGGDKWLNARLTLSRTTGSSFLLGAR
jgi:hypothetical protein